MGRRPNPLILEYFVRGPKLNDSSNRYPHTCKQCGENFPKGRIDSLTTHITKKCPAISDSDRMRACLELHGIAHSRTVAAADRHNHGATQPNGQAAALAALPQGWSALETLAEASRQVDLNENNRTQKGPESVNPVVTSDGQHVTDRFELQEQFTLDNPPVSYENRMAANKRAPIPSPIPPIQTTPPQEPELSPEERLQALLPGTVSSPEPSNISVAVAATARLNPALLDPDLAPTDSHDATTNTTTIPAIATLASTPSILALAATITAAPNTTTTATAGATPPLTDSSPTTDTPAGVTPDPTVSQQPWGEMTYLAAETQVQMLADHPPPPPPAPKARGGIPMEATEGVHGRSRHARSRFTAARRKEVQEVRKIGACIRCRILRKNCGKGNPCDTCRKVLAPRVWRTGCVRTRLYEQLDLWSAGVQVVLSQNRVNALKDQLQLSRDGSHLEVSHLPESGKKIAFSTLVALLDPSESQAADRKDKKAFHQTIMIDQDSEDIPEKIEKYVRDILPLFIEREPSKFMRITLDFASKQLAEGEDDLLRKAIELWGLAETIDRERQWTLLEKPGADGEKERLIKEVHGNDDADIYTMICMQLNAAAERKANNTSKALLNLMDRLLTDSKTKIGFKMFLTALIFLNCVEKSTWAFKAWEQDHLRPGWPLERDPSIFTQQGGNLAGLLKMLLAIRKALPQTLRSPDGKLTTKDTDPFVASYFQTLDLDYDAVQARHKESQFSPAESRSLELMFCSHLLLPNS